jgi:hypothetical protein
MEKVDEGSASLTRKVWGDLVERQPSKSNAC